MASAAVSGDGSEAKVVRRITLISADNERFEVSEAAARLSRIIRNMIEDDCADGDIPLPNVTSRVLAKVLEYCNTHAAAAAASTEDGDSSMKYDESYGSSYDPMAAWYAAYEDDEAMVSFDKEFIDVELSMLYDLLMAANYLNIEGLLDVAARKVADMIKDRTPEQIRQTFGIKNDFVSEDEEIPMENAWAFEE